MKRLMTFVLSLVMTAATYAQEVETLPFNEVKMDIPARLRIVEGESYGFTVEASDESLAGTVECSLKEGVISFSMKKGASGEASGATSYYDSKSLSHVYRIRPYNHGTHSSVGSREELLITLSAPTVPLVKTSAGLEAVAVKTH